MYYKLQPEQFQLHNFSSPSGDLSFAVGSNYVYGNISRFLTGEFGISGSISVNGIKVPVANPSNFSSGSDSFCFGGVNNSVIGVRNSSFNSNDCSVLGTGNACFNSYLSNFPSSSEKNTIIGGRSASISANTTGATFLKDGVATAISSNGNNSLTISYQGGTFIENGRLVLKSSDLHVGSIGSGLFSGNLHVLGEAYKNGLKIATTGDIYNASGILSGRINDTGSSLSARISDTGSILLTTINNTGSSLSARINNTGAFAYLSSGILSTGIINTGSSLSSRIDTINGSVVFKTGDQTIDDVKVFTETQSFNQSIRLIGYGGTIDGEEGSSQIVPSDSGDSVGERGLIAFAGEFLYLKISDAPHIWVRHSGTFNWP